MGAPGALRLNAGASDFQFSPGWGRNLNDPPGSGTIVFVIARPLVHDTRTFLVPEGSIFIIQSCNPFPNRGKRTERSCPCQFEGDGLLSRIFRCRISVSAVKEILRYFNHHFVILRDRCGAGVALRGELQLGVEKLFTHFALALVPGSTCHGVFRFMKRPNNSAHDRRPALSSASFPLILRRLRSTKID
jgi:hypothetical protein